MIMVWELDWRKIILMNPHLNLLHQPMASVTVLCRFGDCNQPPPVRMKSINDDSTVQFPETSGFLVDLWSVHSSTNVTKTIHNCWFYYEWGCATNRHQIIYASKKYAQRYFHPGWCLLDQQMLGENILWGRKVDTYMHCMLYPSENLPPTTTT